MYGQEHEDCEVLQMYWTKPRSGVTHCTFPVLLELT